MTRRRTPGFIVALILILAMAAPILAVNLVSEFEIPLKDNDRVLGSLRGNFIVYGRPNITMYNSRGKAIFDKKLTNNVKPTLSPDGKYLGLVTYADHSPTDLKTTKFSMYDQAGKLQWSMANPAPNSFMIADNGAIFGIEGVEAIPPTRVHLFDPYGNLRDILTFRDYHGILIAPSGNKFIIDRAREGLEVYDSLGKGLASLPISRNYVIDRDDRYIGTFFQGVFHLYQDEKEVVSFKAQEMVLRDMLLNVKENLAVLMAPKRIEVYQLTTKKLLWEYEVVEGSRWLASIDVSDDGQFLVCGIDVNGGNQVVKDKRHVEGYFMLFTMSGQNIAREKMTYETWASGLPKVVFPGASGSLMIQTREKVEKFRIR